jgi:hypothetical protein
VRHRLPAQPDELHEDDVEDAEQHQRSHQLPRVAEDGAEELQLEVRDRERPRELQEAARVAAERARAADLPSFEGRGGRGAHRRDVASRPWTHTG